MSNKTNFFIVVILVFFFSVLKAQKSNLKLIWQIGKPDNSFAEFALAPNSYKEFIPQGFGGAHRYYIIKESGSSKDFPYVLPGPKDNFAGYGYWSGLALNRLPVYFEILKLPKEGFCELMITIFEVSSEQPPLFRCTINGNVYEQQLTPGLSGKIPRNLNSNTQKIIFKVPVSILKKRYK